MMEKKRSILMRVDPNFKKVIDEVPKERLINRLESNIREVTSREITRMMLNTDNFNKVLKELQTKERRKNV